MITLASFTLKEKDLHFFYIMTCIATVIDSVYNYYFSIYQPDKTFMYLFFKSIKSTILKFYGNFAA